MASSDSLHCIKCSITRCSCLNGSKQGTRKWNVQFVIFHLTSTCKNISKKFCIQFYTWTYKYNIEMKQISMADITTQETMFTFKFWMFWQLGLEYICQYQPSKVCLLHRHKFCQWKNNSFCTAFNRNGHKSN